MAFLHSSLIGEQMLWDVCLLEFDKVSGKFEITNMNASQTHTFKTSTGTHVGFKSLLLSITLVP